MKQLGRTTFVAVHRFFKWKPCLRRWPGRGWSLWRLWFEIAKIGGGQ